MDLWVRNQEKTSIRKINNIYVSKYSKSIRTEIDETATEIELGRYGSVERALQILDEIWRILTPIVLTDQPELKNIEDVSKICNYITLKQDKQIQEQIKCCVYQMPKE